MAKHTTKEWFEMYSEIVLNQLNQMLKDDASGDKKLGVKADSDKIKENRASFARSLARVEQDFTAQGLNLSDRVELEGPHICPDELGIPTAYWQPNQQPWVKFFWPDGSSIMFVGEDARLACCFYQWWVGFQNVELQNTIGKSRIIAPGTADYVRYMNAKKADLN